MDRRTAVVVLSGKQSGGCCCGSLIVVSCFFLFFVPLPPLSPSYVPPSPPSILFFPFPPSTVRSPSRSCVHYSCEAIDCQEPLIRNAELRCSSTGRHFYNGDRCTISCNSGYNLQIHQDDDIIKSQVNTSPPDSSPLPPSHTKQGGGEEVGVNT